MNAIMKGGAVLALAAAGFPSTGVAMPNSAMIVPGGELDPAFPGADVFISTPRQPTIPPGRACEAARRYVELINAGDYSGVAALYADDATFLEPMRPTLHGRQQIDEFYNKQIGAMKPRIVGVSFLGGETECMVLLALRTEIDGQERYVMVSVDHFLVNAEGRIVSMIAFARPPRTLAAAPNDHGTSTIPGSGK
jgi:hypothetical protein